MPNIVIYDRNSKTRFAARAAERQPPLWQSTRSLDCGRIAEVAPRFATRHNRRCGIRHSNLTAKLSHSPNILQARSAVVLNAQLSTTKFGTGGRLHILKICRSRKGEILKHKNSDYVQQKRDFRDKFCFGFGLRLFFVSQIIRYEGKRVSCEGTVGKLRKEVGRKLRFGIGGRKKFVSSLVR